MFINNDNITSIIVNISVFAFIFLMLMQCKNSFKEKRVADLFKNLRSDPQVISFRNSQSINNKGGHLQGVQFYSEKGKNYIFLTGSSDTHSYYSVAKFGVQNKVISINKILESPFKHAGGFQIFKNFMAVGIEDNKARDRSEIYLYKIENAEKPPTKPISIIKRSGNYERATAGAVGLTQINKHFLIVVGDWGSHNLDFYISAVDKNNDKSLSFKKVDSINAKGINKDDWINPKWYSYQNINIIRTINGRLFLVGLAQGDQKYNVADLYKLDVKGNSSFSIKKVASRKFEALQGASFRNGAGIYYKNGQLKIISCAEHIESQFVLNIYTDN